MSKRLQIAKKLLNENGVIFISIDDNEQSQLKLLCDEVFGEKNNISQLIIQGFANESNKRVLFQNVTEYCLCYGKDKAKAVINKIDPVSGDLRSLNDAPSGLSTRKKMGYTIYYNPITKDFIPKIDYDICGDFSLLNNIYIDDQELMENGYITIRPSPRNGVAWRWRWGLETLLERKDELVFKQNRNGNWTVEFGQSGFNAPRDYQEFGTGTAELKKFFNGIEMFTKPKSTEFIEWIIKVSTNKNAIILDFFAGSGTTLHATMQLNSEDGGNRQCILVTNNENNICEEVTYERNKRVIEGYNNAKGIFVQGLGANNLRYYQCGFVSSEETELNKRLLTQASSELLSIKENCFEDITVLNGFLVSDCQIFTNSLGKYLVIVYYSRRQMEVCEALVDFIRDLEISERIKLYGFSPEREVLEDDFAKVLEKIVAIPLPEAIRNAYKAIFKMLKFDRETEISENDTPTSVGDLFG